MFGMSAIALRSIGFMGASLSTYPRISKNLTRVQGIFNVDGLGLWNGSCIQRVQRMAKFRMRYGQQKNTHVRKVCGVKRKVGRTQAMAEYVLEKKPIPNRVFYNKRILMRKERDLQVLAMIQEILCRKRVNRNILSSRQKCEKPVDLHAKTQPRIERKKEPANAEIFFRTHHTVRHKAQRAKMQREDTLMRDATLCAEEYGNGNGFSAKKKVRKPTWEETVCYEPKKNYSVQRLQAKQKQMGRKPVQMFENVKAEVERPMGLIEKLFSWQHIDMFKNLFFRPQKKK